jgi:N-acyl amino acid synthase of PEP-CTERM/exosortase system
VDATSLTEHFHQYFALALATTEDLVAEAQRLRYRVYCEEFGYEDKARFPDRRERDVHDDGAFHALITHKTTGKAVACLRLIPAPESGRLPFEENCRGTFDPAALEVLPRATLCEISRFSVDPEFRRRPGEKVSQFGNLRKMDLSPKERRLMPFIGVSILLAGTALTFLTNRRNIFAVMEPFLPQSLRKIGIDFRQVGKPLEYHGTRALYHTRSETVYRRLRPELKDLFHSLYAQLRPSFASAPREPGEIHPA